MIAGLILAAGTASRMGRPKQLLPWRGRPLIQAVIDVAARSPLEEIVVVLGHAHEEIRRAASLPSHVRTVLNPEYASGQASSLAAGLGALKPDARAAVVLLADEPEVPDSAVHEVVHRYDRGGGPVVRARYRGAPGHPVLLDRSIWTRVVDTGADRGAGPVLARHPEWIVHVDIDLDPPAAIDTPEDYESLMRRRPPTP